MNAYIHLLHVRVYSSMSELTVGMFLNNISELEFVISDVENLFG